MTEPVVASIVEGHGEVQAVRGLVSRIAGEIFGVAYVEQPKPYRLPKGKMLQPVELSRAVQLLAGRVGNRAGGVLVILDADDDCAVALRGALGTSAQVPVHVAVAVREFEAWFLASVADPAAEQVRDAKAAFATKEQINYRATIHQARYVASMDMAAASVNSRSFRHFVSSVGALLNDQ